MYWFCFIVAAVKELLNGCHIVGSQPCTPYLAVRVCSPSRQILAPRCKHVFEFKIFFFYHTIVAYLLDDPVHTILRVVYQCF